MIGELLYHLHRHVRLVLVAGVGYRPSVSVEEGVARFVGWYRDYYKV